jgi:hypothetical protein
VWLRTYGDALRDYRFPHPLFKSAEPGGGACIRTTIGYLQRRPVRATLSASHRQGREIGSKRSRRAPSRARRGADRVHRPAGGVGGRAQYLTRDWRAGHCAPNQDVGANAALTVELGTDATPRCTIAPNRDGERPARMKVETFEIEIAEAGSLGAKCGLRLWQQKMRRGLRRNP